MAKVVYRITYPNGKIYVGKDLTGSANYFGSADGRWIARDFTADELRHFVVRKDVLWESDTASDEEVGRREVEFIRRLRSIDPAVGYNRWPAFRDLQPVPTVSVSADGLRWIGPFQFRTILERSIDPDRAVAPEAGGVYLVSRSAWEGRPDEAGVPLYVGSNTGRSARFRTRLGDLVADLFGFFGADTGHHSGGRRLHLYCVGSGVHPLDLHLAWAAVTCARCAENALFDQLRPRLNGSRPSRCALHAASGRDREVG